MKQESSIMKKVIAVIVVFSLFTACFTGFSSQSKAAPVEQDGYMMYTFSDLGFTEGNLTGGQSKAWDIESYDKVAFTGKVAFGKNNVYARIDIGGANGLHIFYSKDQQYFGSDSLCFWDYSGSNLVSWISSEEAGFDLSEEIHLTLKFDVVEETKLQLTVEVASGDKSYERVFPYAANAGMSKSIDLIAGDNAMMTIKSVKPEVVYDTYTFSDLGFIEGNLTGGQSKAWDIESYDKVAFTGKVAFGKNNVFARIDIGGAQGLYIFYSKDQAYFGSDSLCFWDNSGSGLVSWISNEEAGFDLSEEIQLTLKFDVVEETKLQLTVEVASGDKSYERVFPYAANAGMSKSIDLIAGDNAMMTIKSVKPEVVYDTYTFSDLGFVEGEQKGAQSKSWDIESYDKVAFTGNVAFGKNNVYARLDIGGANGLEIFYSKDQAYFGADSLCFWDYSGSGLVAWISNEEAGFDLSQEIQLTLKFDVVEETKLQLTVEVASGDKSYERIFPYAANAGISKSIGLVAYDGCGMTIESIATGDLEPENPENPEEPVYTTYTFSDLGFQEGQLIAGEKKAWNIESYDHVAFTGKVTFGKNNTNTRIVIGDMDTGLHIFYSKDQAYFGSDSLCFWDYSGSGLVSWISNEEAGFDLSEEIQLTLMFDVVEETKIQLTVEVASGDKSYEKTFPYAANAGMSKSIELVVITGYVLKIESISDDTENPGQQVQPVQYKEYTFTDFGIYKSTYDSPQIKSWNIEKLDKVAFTGLITFFEGDDSSGLYFAPSANNWSGLTVRKYGDFLLIESYIGGDSLLIPASAFGVEQLTGTEFKLRLTFDEIGDYVRVTVTVNDIITTYKDYPAEQVHALKTFVLRGSETTPIAVASVGGTKEDRDIIAAWKKFLSSPVNLKYFGFSTNNWQNELKNISK